jgi:hypothetical protein
MTCACRGGRLSVQACLTWWVFGWSAAVGIPGGAEEPLHVAIDRLIDTSLDGQPVAGPVDDAGFLRRVTLDLAGRIPTVEELREFLTDPQPEKRDRAIQRLLDSSEYPRRMQELFHVMLMERRGDDPEWETFLQTAFAQNRPWDQLVREIVAPSDSDEALRGAAFFYTKRLEAYGQNPVDYPGLTRDVGRLFLGVDLQCAQCHDHLFIDDYKQLEFQGLYSVYLNLSIRGGVTFPAVNEKPFKDKLSFVSVFRDEQRETGPRIPFGTELAIPAAPGEGQPVPSALPAVAQQLASPQNPLFARNIVNRLWFVMMGRGLVEPLDLHHSDNPPSHPELLELLAGKFVERQCNIKWFLGERSTVLPDGLVGSPALFAVGYEKRLSAEQLVRSLLAGTGEQARLADAAGAEELKKLREKYVEAFANEPREPEDEFQPTVKGALFLLNDATLLDLLHRRPGNLLDRVAQLGDSPAIAEELYLSVFSRSPSPEELREIVELLDERADQKEQTLEYLVWAMLSSIEFSVNH